MSRSSTPRLPFDSVSISNSLKAGSFMFRIPFFTLSFTTERYLSTAFQAELDAVHRAGPGQSKAEVYKPPQTSNQAGGPGGGGGAWAQGGGWAQPKKNGLMADEKTDFASSLASSLAKAKASNANNTKK
ncbi:hypothetical protein JCM5353_005791 [Sporobolomyces roseus]